MPSKRSKTVVILQPGYLPWLGFFHQMYRSDVFVLYDDVQYTRRDWRSRNRVLGNQGPLWLTVPVYQKGRYHQLILEARINNETDWAAKHLATLKQCYSKAPYFDDYYGLLQTVLTHRWRLLMDLNQSLIHDLAAALGLERKIIRSSQLNIAGEKTDRLLNICKHLGATRYLSGEAATDYLQTERFEKENIEVTFDHYEHPVYRQRAKEFVPYLSIVDLLFHEGPGSLEILANNAAHVAALEP